MSSSTNQNSMEINTTDDQMDSSIVAAEGSDDEEFNKTGFRVGQYWSPHLEEVPALYEKIAQGRLELNWKCIHGRRKPDEETTAIETPQESLPQSKTSEPEMTDFDFEEEATPQLSRLGKSGTPKGGGKKKTTSLAGILSNMERHRIMEQTTGDKQ